jgi:hypothetical protein
MARELIKHSASFLGGGLLVTAVFIAGFQERADRIFEELDCPDTEDTSICEPTEILEGSGNPTYNFESEEVEGSIQSIEADPNIIPEPQTEESCQTTELESANTSLRAEVTELQRRIREQAEFCREIQTELIFFKGQTDNLRECLFDSREVQLEECSNVTGQCLDIHVRAASAFRATLDQ